MELGISRNPELAHGTGNKDSWVRGSQKHQKAGHKKLRSLTQVWTRKERREKKNNNSAGRSEGCPITISRDPGKGTSIWVMDSVCEEIPGRDSGLVLDISTTLTQLTKTPFKFRYHVRNRGMLRIKDKACEEGKGYFIKPPNLYILWR